jgi:cytochrome b involved in lipid metabolism
MGGKNRIIPREELAQHCDNKSCWISVHGVVLDITDFLNEHPGGPDVVVHVSGRDCTQDFEDVGHTDSARRIGDKYIIGSLEGSEVSGGLRIPTNKEIHDRTEASSKSTPITGIFAVTALIAVVAAAFHVLSSRK